ncbi:response regulator [Halobacillus aidingensis]|uniref:Two-component system, chemotaxis family, response regulator CheY/two-component system, NarL family, response regulator DegU n=1 Tax=Halobacillus aidingensis TaxID=240303 RepID=A0A1H0QIY8_HALAD|nr:response regulator [Halobacillus aidingensis]SDP17025.1 two-component system, chemotaxis family, response regulator CheY/two-component system, NarL family, response regulator DegU [Halobacillus aidingensis]
MPTALLVDNSREKFRLKSILERHSYKVLAETEDCMEVLSLYDRYHPELVLMDVSMSDMEGLECLEELHSKYPKAQVIVCSELSDIQLLDRCASLGVIDFIQKPLFHRLSSAIEKLQER